MISHNFLPEIPYKLNGPLLFNSSKHYEFHFPCLIFESQCRSLRNKIEGSHEAARRRAASLPILQCHGNCMSLHNYYVNMSLPIYLTASSCTGEFHFP